MSDSGGPHGEPALLPSAVANILKEYVMPNLASPNPWPKLPALSDWQATADTVHMWLQIIGKTRLELGPWINHSWGNALSCTSRAGV